MIISETLPWICTYGLDGTSVLRLPLALLRFSNYGGVSNRNLVCRAQ